MISNMFHEENIGGITIAPADRLYDAADISYIHNGLPSDNVMIQGYFPTQIDRYKMESQFAKHIRELHHYGYIQVQWLWFGVLSMKIIGRVHENNI